MSMLAILLLAQAASGALALAPCTVPGSTETLRCGTLSVPEDPGRPDGRHIGLRVVVIPALEPDPAQAPLYDLAGGPGLAASDSAGFYLTAGAVHRQHRDIVLVDQRGTGGSAALECPELEGTGSDYPDAAVRACRTGLVATGADLARYTTAETLADLRAVRAALGHGPVDLFGMSYGTRLALAWIDAEPAAIRSAILVGTVPDDARVPLFHGRHAQETLDQVFADCEADAACHADYPDLRAQWATVLARPDFDGTAREALRTRLVGTSGQRALPMQIAAMAAAGSALPSPSAGGPPLAEGLYLSATCAEDTAWIRPEDIAAATDGTFLGDWRIERQRAACELWDVPRRELAYARNESAVPVLFIAGGRDYVTPVAWARRVAARFPNGKLVEIPYLGHFPEGVANLGCIDALITTVAANADLSALDTTCAATMTPGAFARPE